MKKMICAVAMLATLMGAGSCGHEKIVREFKEQEHVLKVGEGIICENGSRDLIEGGFKYAGMPNEETFTVVPSFWKKGYNLYFPVGAEIIGESVKVVEVTPEYLTVKCE
jgi:hypothetical protein